jgi:hypothetical protein
MGCHDDSSKIPSVPEKPSSALSENELIPKGSSLAKGNSDDPPDSSEPTADNGMPFGKLSERDMDNLFAFAKEHSFDLRGELIEVYEKSSKDALGRVFQFSMTFNKLDKNARTYGQIIYSSFLNLGEGWGVEAYSDVLLKQEPQIRQRIRDFIYYPIASQSKKAKQESEASDKECRESYPKMFPQEYVFGKDDLLFK